MTPMSRLEQPKYMPSRRQIAAECEAIRLRWTPSERRRRRVGHGMLVAESMWTPPQIFTSTCLARVRKFVAEASA
jgi:hypothetical protein